MIPEDNKTEIVQSGINFMRSITTAYGTDEGTKLWDMIGNALGPEIKGAIFFAMVTGEYNNRITLSSCAVGSNKISMIRAIRMINKMSLKEAKDLCDEFINGKEITIICDPAKRAIAMHELRNAGFHV